MCFQPTGHLFRETICCGSSVFGDLEVAVILKYFNLQDNVRLSSGSSLASLQKRHAAIWYGRVYLPIYLYHFISGGSSIKEHIKAVNCGVMHSYRTRFFMCVSFGETAVCVCVCSFNRASLRFPCSICSMLTIHLWQSVSVDMYGDVWNISTHFSHFFPVSQDMVRRHPMARLHALTDSRKIRPGVSQYGALSYDRLPVAQGHHNPSIHHFHARIGNSNSIILQSHRDRCSHAASPQPEHVGWPRHFFELSFWYKLFSYSVYIYLYTHIFGAINKFRMN